MITIQTAMLFLLGFFVAALVGFLLAPAYRRRAARLATDILKESMPLTAAEIRADKDRLRAEFAISIHKLESKLETATLASARQMVDINRRDAAISELESEVAQMRTFLDEHENARRVLEQTITERLPRVEQRLTEAKKLLGQRDRELSELTQSSSKHSQALEEATQINAQQRDEIHRLNATLTMYAARNRESLNDSRFDSEVALRVEIESLRAKTRDQSALIGRLQGVLVKSGANAETIAGLQSGGPNGAETGPEAELSRMRKDLAEAELALRSVKGATKAEQASVANADAELRMLKSARQDHQAEIANLRAALKAYEAGSADDRTIKESKIALKARLSALQAQAEEQGATIQTLRSEVAAANEKLARQAAHYTDEMRRLGAGTMPVTGPQRRSLYESPRRGTLAERISAPRLVQDAPSDSRGDAASEVSDRSASGAVAGQPNSNLAQEFPVSGAGPAEAESSENSVPKPSRRPGLLERITGLEKQA